MIVSIRADKRWSDPDMRAFMASKSNGPNCRLIDLSYCCINRIAVYIAAFFISNNYPVLLLVL